MRVYISYIKVIKMNFLQVGSVVKCTVINQSTYGTVNCIINDIDPCSVSASFIKPKGTVFVKGQLINCKIVSTSSKVKNGLFFVDLSIIM